MPRVPPETVIAETSLYQVWRVYHRWLVPPWFNGAVALFVLVGMFLLINCKPEKTLGDYVVAVADTGFQMSISILGFLIAGYTIIASTSNLEMLQRMAEGVDEESGLSHLKKNFYSLVTVFIEYLFVAQVSLMVKLVGLGRVPEKYVFARLPDVLVTCLMAAMITFVLMELKSFIFNVHHFVMTSVAWSLLKRYSEEDKK